MAILGTGIDIVEIDRIRKALEKGPGFENRVYTPDEVSYIGSNASSPQHAAGIFAVKEAVLKAFGIGLKNIEWKDIEVLRDSLGKPYVVLHDMAQSFALGHGIEKIHISISHERGYAVAQAIAEGCDNHEGCGCSPNEKDR